MSFAVLALAVAGAGVAGLALTALATAFLPVPPAGRAVAALLGLALATGLVNAALVVLLRIPAIIATLADERKFSISPAGPCASVHQFCRAAVGDGT